MNTPKYGGRYKRYADGTIVPVAEAQATAETEETPPPAADPVPDTADAADTLTEED
jgi:hypothetical protein